MAENICFRIMTIDDYEKVYSLWMSCRNMGFNNLDDSREGIDKYLKRNPSTCFVAVEGDSVVGVILSGHDGRRGFIHHLAVSEACHALDALKAEGIKKAALLVFNYNEAGNAFWEDQGFTGRGDLRQSISGPDWKCHHIFLRRKIHVTYNDYPGRSGLLPASGKDRKNRRSAVLFTPKTYTEDSSVWIPDLL